MSKPGDINRNDQVLLLKSGRPGNDNNQYIWVVMCVRRDAAGVLCGYQYGSNGTDFFQRKCPKCMDGQDTLNIEGLLKP